MNKYRKIACYLVILVVFSLIFTSFAFANTNKPVRKKLPVLQGGNINKNEFIEVFRIWQIVKYLDLNDEELTKLLPKLRDLENLRKDMAKKRDNLMQQLGRALKSNASDETLSSLISKLKALNEEFFTKSKTMREQIYGSLSIQKRAKLILLENDFGRMLKSILLDVNKFRKELPPAKNPLIKKR